MPLVGCLWSAPEVTAAGPESAMPGDAFHVDGTNLGERPQVVLVSGDRRVPVPVTPTSELRLEGDLPQDLTPGVWELEVHGDHGIASLRPRIDVWTADTEPACAKRYALSVRASRQESAAVIERIFTDRAAVELTLEAKDVAALVLESTPTAAGKTCSALWATRKDGTRVLLADDDTRDLAPFAPPIAAALETSWTRAGDAPPAPAPADPAVVPPAEPGAAPATP